MKANPIPHLKSLAIGFAAAGILTSAAALDAAHWTDGMKAGNANLKSIGPITFGPDAILLVADTKAAAIVALDTRDTQAASDSKSPSTIRGIDGKIAALLGAAASDILINDLAVNPLSKNAYLAVSRGRGPDATPVLIRVDSGGKIEVVALDNVKHSRAEIPNPPVDGLVGQGNRQSNPRLESITDVAFLQDRVLVAGLSNEEFSSTLRSIPFPFGAASISSSAEIYHGAHGRFETRSPVRTFVPFNIGNEPHLLAAYTCTPLVQFPIKALVPNAKVKGKTIAELGNRNRPLDMIVYQKNGQDYLLLANSSRGIMKIQATGVEKMESIETPVPDGSQKGLPYETIASWKGIEQLDRLDAGHALVVRKAEAGSIDLEALPLP